MRKRGSKIRTGGPRLARAPPASGGLAWPPARPVLRAHLPTRAGVHRSMAPAPGLMLAGPSQLTSAKRITAKLCSISQRRSRRQADPRPGSSEPRAPGSTALGAGQSTGEESRTLLPLPTLAPGSRGKNSPVSFCQKTIMNIERFETGNQIFIQCFRFCQKPQMPGGTKPRFQKETTDHHEQRENIRPAQGPRHPSPRHRAPQPEHALRAPGGGLRRRRGLSRGP